MTKRGNSPLQAYRARMGTAGLARVELWASMRDRSLLREAAKLLLADDLLAEQLRITLSRFVSDEQPTPKSLFQRLRESPLVGADLELSRDEVEPREVNF